MQLRYGDGFRSLHCTACKKMSRATHWSCPHAAQWHKCAVCRTDPEEHRTIRHTNRKMPSCDQAVVRLLPADRPGPTIKRQRVSRAVACAVHRKRIIQSANFVPFQIDPDKCPRLAAKFPRLLSALTADHVQESSHVIAEPSSLPCGTVLLPHSGSSVRLMRDMGDTLSMGATTGLVE